MNTVTIDRLRSPQGATESMPAMVGRLYSNPHHRGSMPLADAVGRAGAPNAAHYMVVYLRLEGCRIAEAWFEAHDCPAAVACGSFVTAWAAGRDVAQVGALRPEDMAAALGDLPAGTERCTEMAVAALQAAACQAMPGRLQGRAMAAGGE